MAEQLSGLTGGLPVGGGLGSVTGALQGGVGNLVNMGSSWLDRFFPPEKREAWKAWLTKFATEKPKLAAFLLSQIAISGFPLALFVLMTLTIFIFAIVAGLLVGLIGALLFIVFAVGFALLFLLPTLFFTTGVAVFVWLWGVGTYYIIKWFNEKEIPGIHTDLADGIKEQSGFNDLPGINGDAAILPPKREPPEEHHEEKDDSNAKSTGAQPHMDKKDDTGSPRPRKLATKPNTTNEKGGIPDVGGLVGGDPKKKLGL